MLITKCLFLFDKAGWIVYSTYRKATLTWMQPCAKFHFSVCNTAEIRTQC